jgi:hypothetical protein
MLAGALKTAVKPGLDRVEVQRLQAVATIAKTYKKILADYIDYRQIESKLKEMEELNARLLKERSQDREIRQAEIEKTRKSSDDPVKFFEQVIGFKPFAYQSEFIQLFQDNQFTAARWCRQSGKTLIIAALLL